jgi:hypothetical protein
MSDTPETDAERWIYSYPEYHETAQKYVSADSARKLERERDEARAVTGDLADIASKYLSFLLAVTPSKTNDTHEKETMRVIDALKRWKELSSCDLI